MKTLIAVALFLVAGCGGGGGNLFNATFPDNRADDLQAVERAIAASPPESANVVAGIGAGHLFLYDVDAGRLQWRIPVEGVHTAPVVAGELVITHEQDGIVARAIDDGEVRATIDPGQLHLVGVAGEGDLAAVVVSTGGGVGSRSTVYVLRDGSVTWEADVEQAIGAPGVRAGFVFLPWGTQNLSVIDASSGEERARVRITDEVVGSAFTRDGAVYFGQTGVFRFGSAVASGTRDSAPYFTPPASELPGRPTYLRDAYRPPPAADSAAHKIRLTLRPRRSEGATLAVESDTVYYVFYKLVFALAARAEGGAPVVRWVRATDHDIVGASAQSSGILIADENGTIVLLSAEDGRPAFQAEMGAVATAIDLESATVRSGAPQGEPRSLEEQLLSAAADPDARLEPARELAVRLLAASPDDAATESLLGLCDDSSLPTRVRGAACLGLGERRGGGDAVLGALERHARFLEGTTAPPVGALARAAVTMGERRAVPALVSHLLDPSTPSSELAPILVALKGLADRSAAAPVEAFLRLYHADPIDDGMLAALGAAASALGAWLGPVAVPMLNEIQNDPFSSGPVRGAIQRALIEIENASHAEPAAAEENGHGTARPSRPR